MLLNIENGLTQLPGIQQTYLGSLINAGDDEALVRNPAGFNTNWMQQIGQTGEETAEILPMTSVSGTVMNFGTSTSNPGGTFLYPHALDTPVYQIHYDQVAVFRSTNGTAGPFGSIGVTNITPDGQYTNFNDPSGVNGYAYYVQYYNSLNGDLSGSSSVFYPGGPTFYSLQKMRQRVKDQLYSSGYIRDDSLINDWINQCYEQLVNSAIKVNEDYMLGTNQYGFGTNGLGTVTDPLFKPNVVKVEVTWDGQNYLQSSKLAVREYTEQDYLNFPAYQPQHAWIGETVFEILPHTTGGTARITYPVRFSPLVNDSDEVTQTLKAYSSAFVEYGLAIAYGLDQKDAESQQHMQAYQTIKADFIAEITPRDETGAQMIDIVEGVSGRQEDVDGDMGDFAW